MGTKGDRQREHAILSASHCLAHYGERGATFAAIAEHSQMSQASVVKYLKTRENIFPTVLDYWISRARTRTADAINETASPEEKLRSYLKVSRELFHETRDVSVIILTLHYFAAVNEKYRVINSEIKDVAQKRISSIIEEGIHDGSFKKVNSTVVAKTMHNALMGYLLSSISEIKSPTDLQLPEALADLCLSMVRKS
jgi:AcrR family transcriptional regulator